MSHSIYKVASLGLAGMALTLSGCSDPNKYPRGAFLSGCINGGTPRSVCECTFEHLEKQFSPEELNQFMGHQPRRGAPVERLLKETAEGVQACTR